MRVLFDLVGEHECQWAVKGVRYWEETLYLVDHVPTRLDGHVEPTGGLKESCAWAAEVMRATVAARRGESIARVSGPLYFSLYRSRKREVEGYAQ